MTRARDISNVITDANLGGTLDVSGAFTSLGIDDNADATAMTISSDEDVMIGTTDESSGAKFIVGSTSDDKRAFIQGSNQFRLGLKNGSNNHVWLGSGGADNFRVSNSSGSTLFELNSSGNIVLPSSNAGIHLGVTSATASNLLDDYEEGTWTPSLEASSVDPTVSYTGNRTGSYIKIGDVVHVMGRVNTSSVSGGSGNALITGLPFATGAERNAGAVGYISQVTNSSGYTTTGLNPDASASSMRIVQSGSGVGGATVSIGNIGNGFDLTFSHTYKV